MNLGQLKKLILQNKNRLYFGGLVITCMFVVALLFNASVKNSFMMMAHAGDPEYEFNGIEYAVTEGLPLTLRLWILFSALTLIIVFRISRKWNLFRKDDRGFLISGKGTYGTSEFMTGKEADKEFSVTDIESDCDYMPILGQLTSGGEKTVTLQKPKYPDELRNTLIIGSSGTHKSRGYVVSELVRAIRRGESVVITDPSGELYLKTARFFRKLNVDVKVLNLVNPKQSDYWDLIHETIDIETGRLDSSRLNTFVSVFLHNTSGTDSGDHFWYELSSGYLKATIAYAAFQHDAFVISKLLQIYMAIFPEADSVALLKEFSVRSSLKSCQNKIMKDALAAGCDYLMMNDLILNVERMAPPYSIREVHRLLMNFEEVEEAYRTDIRIPDNYVGKIAYKTCTQKALSENVRSSAILGTLGKLAAFTDENLANTLSNPGINLRNANKKLSAYYLITSEDNADIRPISSLFFSFLFADAKANFDEARQIAEATDSTNMTKDLSVILDEFHSLGVIGGTPDVFVTYMSDSRKRHIHTSIIVQNITQIASNYGQSNAETIISNCNTTLFFGANDAETRRFISEMSGQMTVMAESYEGKYDSEAGTSSGSRYLLTPDEAGRIRNEVVVFRHGCYPLRMNIFDYSLLPEYREGELEAEALQDSLGAYEENNQYHLDYSDSSFQNTLKWLVDSKGELQLEWNGQYENRFYC